MKKKLTVFIILVMALWLYGDRDVDVLTTAQNLTTSWADLGSEIDVREYRYLTVYIQVDINDGANVRLKALPKLTSGGTIEYDDVILTVGSTSEGAEGDYIEWTTDADGNWRLTYDCRGVEFLQLQVQAGTAGAPTAAQIDSCYAKYIK